MKKKVAVSVIAVLSVALVVAAAFAVAAMQKINSTEQGVAAGYRHSFSEIVTGVSELDAALQKSVLVTSPSMASAVCTQVYAKAQTTSAALSNLPFSASGLEKTVSFVNTAGDYAFSLAQKAAKGEAFSQEERDALKSLSAIASKLAQTFRDLENEMGSGLVSLSEYERTLNEYDAREGDFIPETLADSVSVSEIEFPEIPSLIYDGPFSEHMRSSAPKLLEGLEEIDESQGRRSAAAFLGLRPEQVYATGERAGDLPALCYTAEIDGEEVNVCVTKAGGIVVNALRERAVPNSGLSAKEAQDAAVKMLGRWGYKNMKPSGYIIYNNVLTASFAYEQDGVVCYPDLVKVSVAMDNGSMQGFEATGYVSWHCERELPEGAVTPEKAREAVPADFRIVSEQKTLIPSPGGRDVFCYEFRCESADGRDYIIYANMASGNQEKILIVLEDENGTLTM